MYRYEFEEDGSSGTGTGMPTRTRTTTTTLIHQSVGNPKLLLVLPAGPGPSHNGGAITIGPDNNFYSPICDTDKVIRRTTESQNNDQFLAEGTGEIPRITRDGEPVIDPSR